MSSFLLKDNRVMALYNYSYLALETSLGLQSAFGYICYSGNSYQVKY